MIIKVLKLLSKLKIAIFLLFLISFFTAIGSIIEQDQSLEFYKLNYPVNNNNNKIFLINWKIITLLGVDHLYKTWWFNSTILLFGISLFSCSIIQQIPSLKFALRFFFYTKKNQFNLLAVNSSFGDKEVSYGAIVETLFFQKYHCFHQKNNLYAHKGLLAKLSPLLVHLSIIVVLVGTVLSSLKGFVNQELIPKTEIFHLQNNISVGYLSNINQYNTRLNDFWIEYNQDFSVKQFYSSISLLDEYDQDIIRKTVSVNQPLVYEKYFWYQINWDLIGIRIKPFLNNKTLLQLPLVPIEAKRVWLSWIPLNNDQNFGFNMILKDYSKNMLIYDLNGQLLKNLDFGESIFKQTNSYLEVIDIIPCAGLQIKYDPGIPIIYTGFLLLIISTISSYFSLYQIWTRKTKNFFSIGGKANRAKIDFGVDKFKFNFSMKKKKIIISQEQTNLVKFLNTQ